MNFMHATKVCRKCFTERPLEEFRSVVKGVERKLGTCKPCRAKYATEYYEKHQDELRERSRIASAEFRKKNPGLAMKRVHASRDKRRIEDPEGFALAQYRDFIRRKYGVSMEEYSKRLENQNHRCEICGQPQVPGKKFLAVDHCHATGEVRALLCDLCNNGLGSFKDRPETLRAAADYLERHAKRIAALKQA